MRVAVEIELADHTMDDELRAAVGAPAYSGYGMGIRDMAWVCTSEIDLARVQRALKRFGITGRVVETTHPTRAEMEESERRRMLDPNYDPSDTRPIETA